MNTKQFVKKAIKDAEDAGAQTVGEIVESVLIDAQEVNGKVQIVGEAELHAFETVIDELVDEFGLEQIVTSGGKVTVKEKK
jgi:hypothetical protein